MKNFEERKTEVYRRSEIISAKRKKRSAILIGVLPLVLLCVIISSLTVYSLLDDAIVEEEESKETDDVASDRYWGDHMTDIPNVESDPTGDTESEEESYSIKISSPDGSVTEYVLIGNKLYNKTKGEFRKLTDAQLKEIKRIFGLGGE